MPDHSKERLSFNKQPFIDTGIDYFGRVNVTLTRKIRSNEATHKRYGTWFTCLTKRAVHLELASDLSTDIFILALRRFIARCGKPKEILSDNVTNFIDADRELHRELFNTMAKWYLQLKRNVIFLAHILRNSCF